ncbi:hypothetical protein HK103_006245 [Boothiomyces macroporosus]|uniref:L domain-like protein n=1 Tax=Boothiomyces macroporosus TaxID=261099 RepID=A0AAD5UH79_9FUNG|nr:hypothetical protein HK103_006245 [Boothiomyces macroporosus]
MVHWLLLVVKVIAGTSDCDLYNNVIAPALGATTNATRCCDGSTSICTKDGRITKLKLDGLDLVGFIPPELAQITLLDSLDLSENNFCAQPIPDLGGLVNLKSFVAGNSYLSGSLSPWISKLVNLETLEIQENNLNGTVAELGQLTNLKNVSLNSNSFTGTVPQFNQSALQTLDLGLNYFDASDLSWISNLTSLTVLNMDGIPIKGPIPSQVFQIQSLQELYYPIAKLLVKFQQISRN